MTDQHGTPLCQKHVYLANQTETPSDDIKHIAWLMRDMLETDGETTKVQVEQGDIDPEYWVEEVSTWAEGLVIRLGDGDLYEVIIARIEQERLAV